MQAYHDIHRKFSLSLDFIGHKYDILAQYDKFYISIVALTRYNSYRHSSATGVYRSADMGKHLTFPRARSRKMIIIQSLNL